MLDPRWYRLTAANDPRWLLVIAAVAGVLVAGLALAFALYYYLAP